MKRKEELAAVMMAVAYIALPDVGLSRPESICILTVLYAFCWAFLTQIEIYLESKKKPKRRVRQRQRRRTEEYALYETYKDGTVHRVPICQEVI